MTVATEPAIKSYFFGKGYQDLINVIKESWKRNLTSASDFFSKIKLNGEWWERIFTTVFWGGAALSVVVFGTLFFCLVSILHIVFLGLFFTFIYLGFSIVWIVERIFLFFRGLFTTCPDCHSKRTLPEYFCDSCGEIHTKLMPNSYGILFHKCKCGQKLPATFFVNRGRLQARCTVCNQLLHREHVESKKIFIPIFGGPSVGKSAFMFSVVRQLIEKKASEFGFTPEFIDSKTESIYQGVVKQLHKGSVPDKTTGKIPKAFNIALKNDGNTKWLIYLYDPSGEAYHDTENLSAHLYYGYLSGLIMIIDPFSIPYVRSKFEQELSKNWSEVKPSQLNIEDALDRVLMTMEESFSLSKTGKIKKPIAVVINKVDAFGLENIIGEPAVNKALKALSGKSDRNLVRNNLIKQQLITWGEEAIVQQLDSRFKKVHYFSCSALGRIPDHTNKDFVPHHVFESLQWIFNSVSRKDFS